MKPTRLKQLIDDFAYFIVCEIQDLKDDGIQGHPLVWFDDFEELEHLCNFLEESLMFSRQPINCFEQLYYICCGIPYSSVVKALAANTVVKDSPTSFIDDCLPPSKPLDITPEPKEEYTIVGALKQLADDVTTNVLVTIVKVAKVLDIDAKALEKKVTQVASPVNILPKYAASTNVFARTKAKCMIYVPCEDDIDWLKTRTSLDFNDTRDLNWERWKPLVVTCNPRIAGRGFTSITFIPPRAFYWQKVDPTMYGYDVFKLKVRDNEDQDHLVLKMPNTFQNFIETWSGVPIDLHRKMRSYGIKVQEFSIFASPALARRNFHHILRKVQDRNQDQSCDPPDAVAPKNEGSSR